MKERMLEKLKKVEISVSKVKDSTPNTFEEFEKLGIVKDGIYKNLEEAVQNLLDVCALIVKNKNLGIPSEEESFTDLLFNNGEISKDIKNKIDSLRGLRNMLVHRYGEINDRIVYRNIKENIEDFEKSRKSLEKTL